MVITNVNMVTYDGDGINAAWPYTFQIIDGTDVHLILQDVDGSQTVLTSDYYIDSENATAYYPGYAPGAEPPLADQPPKVAVGQKLIVYRDLPITQEADLGEKWPFFVIEKGLDKLTMLLQDIYGWTERSFLQLKNGATSWAGRNYRIEDVANPVFQQDVATKHYVDDVLAGIVAAGNDVIFVDTVAIMRSTELTNGQYVFTGGYHDVNDGGAGVYTIRTATLSDVDDSGSIIILDNGNVAELITDGVVNVKQFGAKGDNSTDDTTAFNNALAFADTVTVSDGTYVLNSQVSMGKDNQKLLAQGDVTIVCNSTTAVFYAQALDNLEIAGFYFEGTVNGTTKQSDNGIVDIHTCTNVLVRNNKFKNIPFAYCIWFRYCEYVQALYNHIDTYYFCGIMAGNSTSYATVNHNTVLNGYYKISGNRYPICIGGYNGELSPFPVLSHNNEAGYNYVEDTTPQWEGIETHGGRNLWIHDNYIKGTLTGVAVVGSPQTSDDLIENIVIENNIYVSPSTYPAEATGQNVGICVVANGNHVVIRGNTVDMKVGSGGSISGDALRIGGISDVALEGFICSNNVFYSASTSVILVGMIKDSQISNNVIMVYASVGNSSSGITSNTQKIDHLIIHDNIIGSCTTNALSSCFKDSAGQTLKSVLPVWEYNNTIINVTTRNNGCTYWLVEAFTLNPNTHLNVGRKGDVVKNLFTTNNAEWVCIQDADVVNGVKGVWIGRNQKSVTTSTSTTPTYIGEICVDNNIVYVAKGLTNADWVQIS